MGLDCSLCLGTNSNTQWSLDEACDWVSLVIQTVKILSAMRETLVPSLGQEDLLEKEWQPTPVFWPGESMDCIVHGVPELDTTERLSLSLVEKYYQAKTKHNDQSQRPWLDL